MSELIVLQRKVTQLDNDVSATYAMLATIEGMQRRQAQRIETIDTRLDGIDSRLEAIDSRLDGYDKRFGKIDSRLESHDARFDNLEALLVQVLDAVNKK